MDFWIIIRQNTGAELWLGGAQGITRTTEWKKRWCQLAKIILSGCFYRGVSRCIIKYQPIVARGNVRLLSRADSSPHGESFQAYILVFKETHHFQGLVIEVVIFARALVFACWDFSQSGGRKKQTWLLHNEAQAKLTKYSMWYCVEIRFCSISDWRSVHMIWRFYF